MRCRVKCVHSPYKNKSSCANGFRETQHFYRTEMHVQSNNACQHKSINIDDEKTAKQLSVCTELEWMDRPFTEKLNFHLNAAASILSCHSNIPLIATWSKWPACTQQLVTSSNVAFIYAEHRLYCWDGQLVKTSIWYPRGFRLLGMDCVSKQSIYWHTSKIAFSVQRC